jgi:hypothetical protein
MKREGPRRGGLRREWFSKYKKEWRRVLDAEVRKSAVVFVRCGRVAGIVDLYQGNGGEDLAACDAQ